MELYDPFNSMDEPSLALLDASVGSTPAADNFRRVFDVPVSTYKVSEGELPSEPADDGWGHEGVVISGSQVSVYEDSPWIEAVEAWVASLPQDEFRALSYRFINQTNDPPRLFAVEKHAE